MLQFPTVEETVFSDATVEAKGEFAHWLLEQVQDIEATPARLTITPAMARVMLRWNNRNRPEAKSKVEQYAALMKKGRWVYNGVPIIFSPERLIDGQHRLMACMKSGEDFEALVVFGAPDDAFSTIDVGKKRSASDIFAINGCQNASIVSAAIKWLYNYSKGKPSAAATSTIEIDHGSLWDFYQEHKRIDGSVWVGHVFGKSRLTAPSIMVSLHYLCADKSRKDADEFFRKVGEGIGFTGKKDPAYRLHQRLMQNIINQEKLGRTQVAALTIKAWNAHRLGREVGTLRFGLDERFPKVI